MRYDSASPDARTSAERSLNTMLLDESSSQASRQADYIGIFQQFVWMGWSAFGGPAAHIGLFQKVLVEKLRWMTSTVFLELLALCQVMPGPTSTQMSFAIGITQQGVTGGLLSGLLFQFPGLLLASAAGIGAANFLKDPAPWLRCTTSGGLAAVGVALVASAAKSLTHKTCTTKITVAINAVAAVTVYYYSPTWIFPVLLILGGLVTLLTSRNETSSQEVEDIESLGLSRSLGAALIVTWLVVLAASVAAWQSTSYETHKELHWWESFYRIGSLIFGGGQVVLPMLDSAVVGPGWISEADFLTGIALVQAMPGPLFNFSAYVGAIIATNANVSGFIGVIICWTGLFAPGILLLYGLLPWWVKFRQFKIYRRALPGVNAAAVGLIVAAVFQLGMKVHGNSPIPDASMCIGIIGFVLVDALDVAAPLVVFMGAALGVVGWATHMH